MPRPLRDRDPSKVHLITCRSRNAELWLAPSPLVNQCIGGLTARYQEVYDITLYAYTYMGNHYHQLAQAPKENLFRYAEDINKQTAHRINRIYGREGSLWGRRYDDQIVITEVDALEGLLYVLTKPTKHGQVSHPKHWPGLNSWWPVLDGKPRSYPFTHYTQYHAAKRKAERRGERVNIRNYQSQHSLRISPIAQYAGMSFEERNGILVPLVEQRVEQLCGERKVQGKGFQGRKKVLSQRPGSVPREVSKSPRPSCYTKNPEAKKQYKKEYRLKRAWYTDASIKFRSGDFEVEFPPHTFRPPLHHIPSDQLVHS